MCCLFPADMDIDHFELLSLDPDMVRGMEADSFWCFSKLLDGIQDNYTFAQPGIQSKVNALKDIISRIDSELSHRFCMRRSTSQTNDLNQVYLSLTQPCTWHY